MFSCANCGEKSGAPLWRARHTRLWTNQHGFCVRLFCDVCGQWTDLERLYDSPGDIVTVRREPRPGWKAE